MFIVKLFFDFLWLACSTKVVVVWYVNEIHSRFRNLSWKLWKTKRRAHQFPVAKSNLWNYDLPTLKAAKDSWTSSVFMVTIAVTCRIDGCIKLRSTQWQQDFSSLSHQFWHALVAKCNQCVRTHNKTLRAQFTQTFTFIFYFYFFVCDGVFEWAGSVKCRHKFHLCWL